MNQHSDIVTMVVKEFEHSIDQKLLSGQWSRQCFALSNLQVQTSGVVWDQVLADWWCGSSVSIPLRPGKLLR